MYYQDTFLCTNGHILVVCSPLQPNISFTCMHEEWGKGALLTHSDKEQRDQKHPADFGPVIC